MYFVPAKIYKKTLYINAATITFELVYAKTNS
jgi:hypothetical protein